MTKPLNPAVVRAARRFGLDPAFIQALVDEAGGPTAFIRSIHSVPTVKTLEQALDIACRTVVRRLCEWVFRQDEARARAFIDFFTSGWSP